MTAEPGSGWFLQRRAASALATVVLGALAACDGAGPSGRTGNSVDAASDAGTADAAPTLVETDIEAPEAFQVTEQGLWDGRPSLGGVWVAHPDVSEPERVVIRNLDNGQFVIGALFRRERENPGPALQVSSDAAEALGLLAGAPATLDVTALRREETAEAAPLAVGDSAGAPVEGEAAPATDAVPSPDETADATARGSSDPAEAVARATAAILEGNPPSSMQLVDPLAAESAGSAQLGPVGLEADHPPAAR